jgi:hypothetical protein
MTTTINNVGVSFLKEGTYNWEETTICVCSCGRSFYGKKHNNTCECGNAYFKLIPRPSKSIKTNVGGTFECIESNNNSFVIKKKELIAHFTVGEKTTWRHEPKDYSVKFVEGKEYTLHYSLRNKLYEVYHNNEKFEDEKDLFFRGNVLCNEFLNCLGDNEQLKTMLKFAYSKFGQTQYSNKIKWSKALKKLFDYPYIELLSNCGLGKHLNYIYGELRYGNQRIDIKKSKPHEIFGVPKYMMAYIKEMETVDYNIIRAFKIFDKAFDGNRFKMIMQIYKEESNLNNLCYNSGLITELFEKYGYKDVKKLALYVTREVKLQQGIMDSHNALTYLRDYAKMCKDMDITWEKFPKSLKKEHDITSMNYKAIESELKNKAFKNSVERYSELAYTTKKDKYEIIVPQIPSDLVKEGSALNHCIASYVDNVISGACKILFMRNKEDITKPFVSIEIRDGFVRQARGQSNKSIERIGGEAFEFFNKWIEKMELTFQVH